MRLICPNCSAQYEVDANLIPEDGRDVQCSNCGNTWFELPEPAAEPSEAAHVEEAPEPETEPEAEAQPRAEPEPEPTPQPEPSPEPAQEPAVAAAPAKAEASGAGRRDSSLAWPGDDTEDEEWLDASVKPNRPKRPKDVAAVDILKEEAEREIGARRSETTAGLETQSEMGLEPPRSRETPSRALRARMARMKTEDTGVTDAPEEGDYSPPRRDLLPDIEEINSSLGPSARKSERSEAGAANHRRGFRYGFLLTVGAAVLAVSAYAWAPAIVEALPGSEGALLAYVDWANGARDALDRLIGQAAGG